MSFLGDLRERIPDFNLRDRLPSRERLYSLLAFVVIIATGVGYAFFAISSIVPQWQIRQTLVSQLAAVEQQLMESRKGQETSLQNLEEQLAQAQAALDEAASIFLSEAEAAGVLTSLYQYADESGVEIISLQEQAEPEGEGEEETENVNKRIYDVRVFQLQIEGSTPNLITFVSQIEEAAYKGFIITNVNIAEGAGRHVLTMNISLYTSPYSSGAAGQVTPVVTPSPAPADLAQLEGSLAAAWASKDWEQAIILTNQILAIDPNYDDVVEKLYTAHVNYGYRLWEEGDSDAATMQFSLALGIKPGGEEALAGLQQIAVTPTPTLTVEEQLARRLDEEWEAGNWEEVIGLLEQILALNPDDDEMTEKLYVAHVNYGHALAAEGRLEEAKEEFSRALEIRPDGAEAAAGLQQLAGEVLPPTPIPESQYTIHVVQRGENLYRISLRYSTTVEAIMAANGLTSHNIYVGQQLRIPLP
ncbi:MAG: LysM peptidoglycan-binding domain-containing protein [Anaerolineae bacterium]|nr:LysM peptidoglycan-binding domain-containing protein [Anaerolineae bacterium]